MNPALPICNVFKETFLQEMAEIIHFMLVRTYFMNPTLPICNVLGKEEVVEIVSRQDNQRSWVDTH